MEALMKIKEGPGHVKLVDIPEPDPGAGEVKIEIRATGVCGTDIHIRNDRFKSYPPVVLGHEISGRVVAVGTGVEQIQVGDDVTLNPGAGSSCGKCSYCRSGYYMFCPQREGIGSRLNGGFARYIVVRQEIVYQLPKNIDLNAAALCEPLACAVQAVLEQSEIHAGDVVYISGPGLMGLLATQLVLAQGGRAIVGGLPMDQERLAVAEALGAEATIILSHDDIKEKLHQICRDQGLKIALECAGTESSLNLCLKLLAAQGQLTQIGIMKDKIILDYNQVFFKQLQIRGSFATNWRSWDTAMLLLRQGKVHLEPLVSALLPLESWEEAFTNLEEQRGIRTLLYPAI